MARYYDLAANGVAIERVKLPIANVPHGIQKGTPEQKAQWERDGKPEPVECGIRILPPGFEAEADQLAAAKSVELGVEKYDENNPICYKQKLFYTVAAVCVDPDSDPKKPTLFFGDTIEEAAETLRSDPKKLLTFDTVVYLHERYLTWRDKLHPQANTIKDFELQQICQKAVEDADFLLYLRPGMLLRLAHTLAALYLTLPVDSSGSVSLPLRNGESSSTTQGSNEPVR